MRDPAHALADKELEDIEKRIEEIYRRASHEVEARAEKYFKRFDEMDKKKRALVDAGKLTEEEYLKWKKGKLMTGKHWTTLKNQTAESMLNANTIATDYVNGRLPSVYAANYNQVASGINGQVHGVNFELVNQQTVRNLATKDKTLLPYKKVNGLKDVRWNTQKVNAEILQGIIQGDSVDKLSKRLEKVTEMNRASAVRNARTSVTSAENKGRLDMIHDAEDAGVKTKKVWLSVHDKRTRDAHLALSGVEADPDEPFEVFGMKIMYPGDPDAEPEMVYNCRCTMTYRVVGFMKDERNQQEQQKNNGQSGTALNGDPYSTMPDTLGGVQRGEEMSFDEANNRAANPGYRAGSGTSQNCQSCVVAHEARIRGYDVEAESFTNNKTAKILSEDTRAAWVDPKTGAFPNFIEWDYNKTYDKYSFSDFLQEKVEANGRYTMEFQWKNAKCGHIINIDRDENGLLRFYDAQTGKKYTKDWAIDDLLGKMKYTDKFGRPDPPHLLRVDNLAFRENVVNDILKEEREGWKRKVASEIVDDWIPF